MKKEYDYEKMTTEGFSCDCEVAGYCPLLDKDMSPHLHNLCKTNPLYRNRFLENAKNSGKKTENGKNMFIYQAMKAFQTWHGIKPEINEEVRDLIK